MYHYNINMNRYIMSIIFKATQVHNYYIFIVLYTYIIANITSLYKKTINMT